MHRVQNYKHGKRIKKFSICFPSVVTVEDNGEFNFPLALFTGNQNVTLIEIEDLLRKLKSNLKNLSDVGTKERCYSCERSEKIVALTRSL